jgi:hypothetical protein|tara:strand:+ start:335 stop:673 length:339 start_codon:yes stop_codon:yes gene_type:complete
MEIKKFTLQILFEIILYKKSKHCVTLRADYPSNKNKTFQERVKEFRIRIHVWTENNKITNLLTQGLLKLAALAVVKQYFEELTLSVFKADNDDPTTSYYQESVTATQYICFT